MLQSYLRYSWICTGLERGMVHCWEETNVINIVWVHCKHTVRLQCLRGFIDSVVVQLAFLQPWSICQGPFCARHQHRNPWNSYCWYCMLPCVWVQLNWQWLHEDGCPSFGHLGRHLWKISSENRNQEKIMQCWKNSTYRNQALGRSFSTLKEWKISV